MSCSMATGAVIPFSFSNVTREIDFLNILYPSNSLVMIQSVISPMQLSLERRESSHMEVSGGVALHAPAAL